MRETRNLSTTISFLYNVTQPNETTHCYQDESSSGCKDLPDISFREHYGQLRGQF
jgi:hypothetical protein